FADIQREVLVAIGELRREVTLTYNDLVLARGGIAVDGLPRTLYAYVMSCFAQLDFLSALWADTGRQTPRMVDFMDSHMGARHDAHTVAIQLWRHTLLHTGTPREITQRGTGI